MHNQAASVSQASLAPGVNAQEDEEQDGESPQRRTAIAEERQRNADNRRQAQHHTYINEQVEQEDAKNGIAINTAKGRRLTLGHRNKAQYQGQEKQQHGRRADKTLFLTHGAEDEVRILFGHVLQLGLGAVQESFSGQPARADGYPAPAKSSSMPSTTSIRIF